MELQYGPALLKHSLVKWVVQISVNAAEAQINFRVKRKSNHKKSLQKAGKFSRDDWIRTSDHTPPRRVRYRAALRPELRDGKGKGI